MRGTVNQVDANVEIAFLRMDVAEKQPKRKGQNRKSFMIRQGWRAAFKEHQEVNDKKEDVIALFLLENRAIASSFLFFKTQQTTFCKYITQKKHLSKSLLQVDPPEHRNVPDYTNTDWPITLAGHWSDMCQWLMLLPQGLFAFLVL